MKSCRATARTYRWFGLGAWVVPLLLGTLLGGALGCASGGGNNATIALAPTVVTGPAAQTILQGQPVTFAVTVDGTAPFTYQWNKDGSAIAGATSPAFTIAAVAASDAGSYTVTIGSAGGGATSSAAVLTVTPLPLAPAITTQPLSATVIEGQPAGFTVAASGTAPLTYQWSLGGAALAGATGPTYAIAAAAAADAGSYAVTVTNAVGSVTSAAATLTVNPATIAPSITTQPLGASVTAGQSASFTVVAAGTVPFTYQWSLGSTAIPGATAATYGIAAAASADAGSYTVKVTNGAGSATSSAATLTVYPVLVVTAPSSQTAADGATATFSVTASGVAPYTYQWLRGATAIPGATASSYTTGVLSFGSDNAASFSCAVTDALARTTTSAAAVLTVTVTPAPVITVQPASKAVRPPDGATFAVTATGNGLTYAWKKNGTAIAGATSSSYTVTATDLHNVADQYLVTVTNGGGSVDSTPATLTVQAPSPVYAGDPLATGNANYHVVSSWFTTAPADPVLGSFRLGYDTAMMNPLWSSACFFPSAPFTFARPATYPDDTRIPGSLTSSDYTNTGFARGHQTGFADLRDTYGPDAGASTMYMTNMCPQDQTFNGGEWNNFETLATQTYPSAFGRVWVYTGPIFAVQLVNPIGAKNIPVPNAFYKIMVRETASGTPKVLAAIVPHSSTLGKPGVAMADTDFWKFTTTVDRVQELTGLTFFPTPTSPLPATFTSAVEVTGWGAPLEQGPNKPNVYMINPSWDTEFKHIDVNTSAVTIIDLTTAVTGTAVPFKAMATPDPDAIVSTSWNFGDGSALDPTLDTTHAFSTAGDFTVTFTATDAAGHSNSISHVVTIAGSANTPPVFTPGTLPSVSVPFNTSGTATFTLADDTTAAASITVAATSGNTALLANAGIVAAYQAGTGWTLTLTPVTGQSGSALVTVVATDRDSATTTRTFTFVVQPAVVTGSATLIISQYYEGTSNNKWIEITNVGTGTWDAATSPMYLCQWNNPRTTNKFYGLALTGTLAPGASMLFRNTSAILPANPYNTGGTTAPNGARIITDTTVMGFNGNDVMYLSTTTPSSATDLTSYTNRTDAIGAYLAPGTDQSMLDWDPATPVVIPAGWGATATPPGQDRSFVRNASVLIPNPTYTPAEWTQVDAVQITATALGLVETATPTSTNYLGYHSYTGGNP